MSVSAREEDSQTPRLRGHHFVCLQFFAGQGYSFDFVQNLRRVIERVTDAPALLVEGADDVCVGCPGLAADGICLDPNAGETEIRRIDRLALQVLDARPGDQLSLAQARERLSADAITAGRWRFEACHGCTWEDVCDPGWGELLGDAEKEARR
jgi:uncharacterized protein